MTQGTFSDATDWRVMLMTLKELTTPLESGRWGQACGQVGQTNLLSERQKGERGISKTIQGVEKGRSMQLYRWKPESTSVQVRGIFRYMVTEQPRFEFHSMIRIYNQLCDTRRNGNQPVSPVFLSSQSPCNR
jgi:hypothetical protein